jgi:hypothetical protein
MMQRNHSPLIDSKLLNEDGEPLHYSFETEGPELTPVIAITFNNTVNRLSIDTHSIESIVTQSLPEIINSFNVAYINKDFKRVKHRITKALKNAHKNADKPIKNISKSDMYDSLSGQFFKNGRWRYFSVTTNSDGLGVIKYARRDVGIIEREISRYGFDVAFNEVYGFMCKKVGINPDSQSLHFLKVQLRHHLAIQYAAR